jgi:hypothetical protein
MCVCIDGPQHTMIVLNFFDIMMIQKQYASRRKHSLHFDHFPGQQYVA